MKNYLLKAVLSIFVACFLLTAYAEPKANAAIVNPVAYMQHIANQLLVELNKNKSQLSNQRLISKIICDKVVPYFDLGAMARLVLGRQFWTQATPEQRSVFQAEFTKMVISTYASAMEKYDDDQIKFYPLRSDFTQSRLISLSSVVLRRDGSKINVSYNLLRTGNSWRVYDFAIEGISMVSSYRDQFNGTLYSKGLAALIDQLKRHNQKVAL